MKKLNFFPSIGPNPKRSDKVGVPCVTLKHDLANEKSRRKKKKSHNTLSSKINGMQLGIVVFVRYLIRWDTEKKKFNTNAFENFERKKRQRAISDDEWPKVFAIGSGRKSNSSRKPYRKCNNNNNNAIITVYIIRIIVLLASPVARLPVGIRKKERKSNDSQLKCMEFVHIYSHVSWQDSRDTTIRV